MKINLQELQALIEQKYISVQKHRQADLYIYNYTPLAQYERYWTPITLHCRGLILNSAGEIVARPLPKFFNLEELQLQQIPNEPFEVYEKMDGSLGILYWIGDKPFIASRGSFDSDQARKATQLLHTRYAKTWSQLKKDCTYLFEIIYPQNRIVVDYGNREELALLAILDTVTGQDLPLENIGFPLVEPFDGVRDFQKLKELEIPNKEGFVLKFVSGFRVKVKFSEYLRLHRILTQVSNQAIWEMLKNGSSLDQILDKVPDEFYEWVRQTKEKLLAEYKDIEEKCRSEFKMLEDRKSTALYFNSCSYPSILFAMLDGKEYSERIWRLIKPTYEKPFSSGE